MSLARRLLGSAFGKTTRRRSAIALGKLLFWINAVVVFYAVLFHFIMAYEGQEHSLFTGFYWTLSTMSTVGYGDIVFSTDMGRVFSAFVIGTGIVLIFVVLPFAFVSLVYAPWMEAQLRYRAPSIVPTEARGHVLICGFGSLSRGLMDSLRDLGIEHYLIESDPEQAAKLHADGVPAVAGAYDSVDTYEATRAAHARLVVANVDDSTNATIAVLLTSMDPPIPVAAIAEHDTAAEVLALAGATTVLPLTIDLGRHLAARVTAGNPKTVVETKVKNLVLAEFSVTGTPLEGKSIRDTALRETCGVSIVACWQGEKLQPVRPALVLDKDVVVVVAGTPEKIEMLDKSALILPTATKPTLVIGGGQVGRSCARSLRTHGCEVHIIEANPDKLSVLEEVADQVVIGDARAREVLEAAGVHDAGAAVLAADDDAINVYLAIYLRRLNPKLRIICRVSFEKSSHAVRRAGADYALSAHGIGIRALLARIHDMEVIILGLPGEESVGLFLADVPSALFGKTLAASEIGALTGLSVVAVQEGDDIETNPHSDHCLKAGSELLMLGTMEQRREFSRRFGH